MKNPRIVGNFIRKRREALTLSQRALGQLFDPPVTTQFISNVERGVTPLPPAHVPTLAKALRVPEAEMMGLLQKEYAMKLSGRMGKDLDPALSSGPGAEGNSNARRMEVDSEDYEFMNRLYEAYKAADNSIRTSFLQSCQELLGLDGSKASDGEDADRRKSDASKVAAKPTV